MDGIVGAKTIAALNGGGVPAYVPPTSSPPVSGTPGKCETYRPLVAQAGLPVNTFMALMWRESGCQPNAVGSQGDAGLLQIHPITKTYLAGKGLSWGNRFDPWTNIRMAKALYDWGCKAGDCLRPWRV